jgi:adenine-specific DNA methylase
MAMDPEEIKQIATLIAEVKGIGEAVRQQNNDIIRTNTEQNAQLREIKHTLNGQAQSITIMGERFAAHVTLDEKTGVAQLEATKENRQMAEAAIRRTAEETTRQIADIKDHTAKEAEEVKSSFKKDLETLTSTVNDTKKIVDDLFTWRGKILAILGFLGGTGTVVYIIYSIVKNYIDGSSLPHIPH